MGITRYVDLVRCKTLSQISRFGRLCMSCVRIINYRNDVLFCFFVSLISLANVFLCIVERTVSYVFCSCLVMVFRLFDNECNRDDWEDFLELSFCVK